MSMLKIKGIAHWPKLKTPDSYNGNVIGYTIQVEPAEGEFDRVMAVFKEVLEQAKGQDEFKGKAWLENPNMGLVENADGSIYLKFKKVHEFRDKKTGEMVKMTVPVYDKHGIPIDVEVGNGSEVVVAFTPRPYHMNKNNNGLSLRLDAVQVLNLKTRAMGADYFGFQVDEEGQQAQNDNPFA